MKTQTQYTMNKLLEPTPKSIQNKEDYLYFLKLWKEVYKYYANLHAINKLQSRIHPNTGMEKKKAFTNRLKKLKSEGGLLKENMSAHAKEITKYSFHFSYTTPVRKTITYGCHAVCIQLLETRAAMKSRFKEILLQDMVSERDCNKHKVAAPQV